MLETSSTLSHGQFLLSIQLIILNYPFILSYQYSTTVSLETYPLLFINADRKWFEHRSVTASCGTKGEGGS